jgi:hypothetical protein
VRYLAEDALEGRLAGTPGAGCAADFIANRFAELGLLPAGDDGGWFEAVTLESAVNPHLPGGTGRNVVGRLPGRDPERAPEVVIVGAHFDHLGRGEVGSLAAEAGEIHNGADDNASGVAGLLAAAGRLVEDPPAISVVFVAFTGEELGLLGSAAYAGRPRVALEQTRAMINLDMIGRLEDGPLIVSGTGTAAEWDTILSAAAGEAAIELASDPSGYGPSDHTSFYLHDVPVLHFFTNVHADYHRPSDDWQKVDVDGVERIAGLVADVVRRIGDRAEPLTLVRDVGTPPASEGEGRGYGAWLGTVPDFTPVENGVRVGGVTGGSPAEAGGLAAGDVIVGLGVHAVEDLPGLTAALRAHAPGDAVIVRVLREGTQVDLPVTLGDRSDRPKG